VQVQEPVLSAFVDADIGGGGGAAAAASAAAARALLQVR
jgi:ribosomal protein S9